MRGRKKWNARRTRGEVAFEIFCVAVVTLFAAICVFPFVYVLSYSVTPYQDYLAAPTSILPRRVSFEAYRQLAHTRILFSGYQTTVIITVLGTAINLFLLCITAYPLSKKNLKGQKLVMSMIIFTMFFSGGMIPNYTLIRNLKLMNTYWALILPSAISTYNLILMRNFISQIPESLEESAYLDGANHIRILFSIILPLCKASIMTFLLFYAVSHWNAYFDASIYITKRGMWPLMLVLRDIVVENSTYASDIILEDLDAARPFTMKMAAIIFSMLPILCVYPIVQKYFMKGVLLGSVKG